MNWQELTVFALVLLAAIYAGRIFVQQFGMDKKSKEESCTHCTPRENKNHQPLQIFKKKSS